MSHPAGPLSALLVSVATKVTCARLTVNANMHGHGHDLLGKQNWEPSVGTSKNIYVAEERGRSKRTQCSGYMSDASCASSYSF